MMTLIRKAAIAAIALLLMPLTASADGNFVLFKYGNFDTWVTRQIPHFLYNFAPSTTCNYY